MLRLPNKRLPSAAGAGLRELQSRIDVLPTYAERVAAGKKAFAQRNKSRDPVFGEVRRVLREMVGDTERCAYCEDSALAEVEHIAPKDLYPEAVFTWTNYLYSCGPCNRPKSSHFAILEEVAGVAVATSVGESGRNLPWWRPAPARRR